MSPGNEGKPSLLRHNQHHASNVARGGRHRRLNHTGLIYPNDLHSLLRNGLPETHKLGAAKLTRDRGYAEFK
jgi:hypothetical protein